MKMNLYPFNYYILLASFILLIIMLVLTLVHAAHLLQAVKEKQPVLDNIQKNVKLSEIKAEAMQEKKEEDDKKNRIWKVITPAVLAVYETYKRDPELKGLKGWKQAAKKAASDRRYSRRIQDMMNVRL